MRLAALPIPASGMQERLPATIAFALLLHLTVILGVRFVPESEGAQDAAAVEVTQVREQTVSAPDDARYLAPSASRGGGNNEFPAGLMRIGWSVHIEPGVFISVAADSILNSRCSWPQPAQIAPLRRRTPP